MNTKVDHDTQPNANDFLGDYFKGFSDAVSTEITSSIENGCSGITEEIYDKAIDAGIAAMQAEKGA